VSGCERKPDRAQPSRDGTTHIVLDPVEMLQKLAALVPAPHAHLVRYAGLFAPAAKRRSAIVPTATSSTEAESTVVSRGVEISICLNDSSANFIEPAIPDVQPSSVTTHARNYTWAELMKRVCDHATNYIVRSRNIQSCPDYSSVSSTVWPGDRFRRSTATMG